MRIPQSSEPSPWPEPAEPETGVVRNAIAGDGQAFGELYDRYRDRILRYFQYRVCPEDAEDLTQLVFMNAWRAIGRYEISGPFAAWLFTIARNCMISHCRSSQHGPTLPLLEEMYERLESKDDPHRAVEVIQDRERVRAAISRLGQERQEVISMRFVEDLPCAAVAEATGRSEVAVRVMQHRAVNDLRRIMNDSEPWA